MSSILINGLSLEKILKKLKDDIAALQESVERGRDEDAEKEAQDQIVRTVLNIINEQGLYVKKSQLDVEAGHIRDEMRKGNECLQTTLSNRDNQLEKAIEKLQKSVSNQLADMEERQSASRDINAEQTKQIENLQLALEKQGIAMQSLEKTLMQRCRRLEEEVPTIMRGMINDTFSMVDSRIKQIEEVLYKQTAETTQSFQRYSDILEEQASQLSYIDENMATRKDLILKADLSLLNDKVDVEQYVQQREGLDDLNRRMTFFTNNIEEKLSMTQKQMDTKLDARLQFILDTLRRERDDETGDIGKIRCLVCDQPIVQKDKFDDLLQPLDAMPDKKDLINTNTTTTAAIMGQENTNRSLQHTIRSRSNSPSRDHPRPASKEVAMRAATDPYMVSATGGSNEAVKMKNDDKTRYMKQHEDESKHDTEVHKNKLVSLRGVPNDDIMESLLNERARIQIAQEDTLKRQEQFYEEQYEMRNDRSVGIPRTVMYPPNRTEGGGSVRTRVVSTMNDDSTINYNTARSSLDPLSTHRDMDVYTEEKDNYTTSYRQHLRKSTRPMTAGGGRKEETSATFQSGAREYFVGLSRKFPIPAPAGGGGVNRVAGNRESGGRRHGGKSAKGYNGTIRGSDAAGTGGKFHNSASNPLLQTVGGGRPGYGSGIKVKVTSPAPHT